MRYINLEDKGTCSAFILKTIVEKQQNRYCLMLKKNVNMSTSYKNSLIFDRPYKPTYFRFEESVRPSCAFIVSAQKLTAIVLKG